MRYKVFAALLTLLMLSFFFVAERHQRNWLLYLAALSAHAFMADAAFWRRAFADGRGWALLILTGFPLLSLGWSDGIDPHAARDFLVAGYCIVAIYFGVVQLVDARPQDLERLKHVLLGAAVIGSALSLGNWLLSDLRFIARLQGVFALHNSVHASILILAATLPAVRRIRTDRAGVGWLAACVLPWLFVMLAAARTAVAAYLIVVVWLIARRQTLRVNLVVGTVTVLVVAGVVLAIGPDRFEVWWVARGLSYRDEIWTQVWARFRDCNPLIGCGLGAPLNITFAGHPSSRPHSIVLGVLYYQGVVGLVAFVTALGYLTLRALRETGQGVIDRGDWVVMLGYALLANLTSGDHIIVRATLFWSYFWLPVVVLAALRAPSSEKGNSP